LERKIKLCEVLALEDFKAWMKNMKKQGTRGSRFFYWKEYKGLLL